MFEKFFSNPDVVMAIIAVIAIISPIVTTIINNRHENSVKKIELYELAKRKSLEDFIKCASRCFDGATLGYAYDYYNCLNNLYIYFSDIPKEAHTLLNLSHEAFNDSLTNIVITLSKQISKK